MTQDKKGYTEKYRYYPDFSIHNILCRSLIK